MYVLKPNNERSISHLPIELQPYSRLPVYFTVIFWNQWFRET